MTKKHFVQLAQAIREIGHELTARGIDGAAHAAAMDIIAHKIAAACRMSNANFDTGRFRDACGLR